MFYSILWFSDHSKIWFKQMFNLRVRSARISEVNASTPIYIWGETDSRSRWCLSINIICFIVQERTFLNFKDFKIYLHNRVHCVFKLFNSMFDSRWSWLSFHMFLFSRYVKQIRAFADTRNTHSHSHSHIHRRTHPHSQQTVTPTHTDTTTHIDLSTCTDLCICEVLWALIWGWMWASALIWTSADTHLHSSSSLLSLNTHTHTHTANTNVCAQCLLDTGIVLSHSGYGWTTVQRVNRTCSYTGMHIKCWGSHSRTHTTHKHKHKLRIQMCELDVFCNASPWANKATDATW